MESNMQRKQLLDKVLNDQDVQKLIKAHHLSVNFVDQNLNPALAFVFRKAKCQNCPGLEKCQQATTGYSPLLNYDGIKLELSYQPCAYLKTVQAYQQKQNNLHLIACNLNNMNLEDIYVNDARKEVLKKIKNCLANYEKNLSPKGIYIHGNYGCGKTYLLAYLAHALVENNHQVIFAYYPALARMFRSAITDGSLESLIDELKEAEVLILDDFGGETLSSYIRDEVLGAILQERMSNKRLTFMSSNLDEQLLFAHLKESNRDIDDLRASRIYERIRTLMEFVKLSDQNYRN